MSSVAPNRIWQHAVTETRGMKATWPIDTELAVGTFGSINSDGAFVRRGTLEDDFGISIDTAVRDRQDALAWTSEGVSSVSGLSQADAGELINIVAAGSIDMQLSFQRAGAIAYRFEGTSTVIPRDQSALAAYIAELARKKKRKPATQYRDCRGDSGSASAAWLRTYCHGTRRFRGTVCDYETCSGQTRARFDRRRF